MARQTITQGIHQTGVVEVVGWESALPLSLHVQAEVDAGRVTDPVSALVEETGAEVVISGTYYQEGDNISIHADVNSAVGPSLLGSIEPVTGPRESTREAVGQLQQYVMGFLAVRYDELLTPTVEIAGAPPPWEAYREFNEGLERYLRGQGGAQAHFRRAVELHPEYPDALLYLATVFSNRRRYPQLDSVLDVMSGLGDRLPPYHRAYAEGMRWSRNGDLERALAALGRIEELTHVLDELESISSPYPMHFVLFDAVQILRADGHTDAAEEILSRSIEWFENSTLDEASSAGHMEIYGWVLLQAGRPDDALEAYNSLVDNYPEHPNHHGYRAWRGFVAAMCGDTAQALEDDKWLAEFDGRYNKRGQATHGRAFIAGALGQRAEAMFLLRQAYQQGRRFWMDMEWLLEFDPLRSYPPFEEWLRPKG
jgi:tetratricopeptide (TPR) repeat protein